jgi:hypothetical protein
MLHLRPYLVTFVIAGAFLMSGILMVIYPLITNQLACYFNPIDKNFKVDGSNLVVQNSPPSAINF